MQAVVGIDVSKATLAVALWREGPGLEQATFANTRDGHNRLHHFLKKRGAVPAHACLEATGRYWEPVAEFLVMRRHRVSVVNPARIKAYAASQLARHKTDRLDAALIADFCRTQQPPAWSPPAPHQRELQLLVRHLEDLESDRQRLLNRRDALRQATPPPTRLVTTQLQEHLQVLDAQIEQVKTALQDHIDHHPDLKRAHDLLVTIQGIGPLTAAKLLGEYGDMSQFTDVRQVVALAGLHPTQRQSGARRGTATLSKLGRPSIRAALYMPALVAKRHNPRLAAFAARLEARGLRPMQIIAALMRKLLHFAYGVLKSNQPYQVTLQEAPIA